MKPMEYLNPADGKEDEEMQESGVPMNTGGRVKLARWSKEGR